MEKHTKELENVFKAEKEILRAGFLWNQLDDESKKRDLTEIFLGRNLEDELLLSRLLMEDHIAREALLLIPEMAIEVSMSWHDEIASWVGMALSRGRIYKKMGRSFVTKEIFKVAGKAGDDGFVYRRGWDMLFENGYKKELLEYMDIFSENLKLEIDEDDMQAAFDLEE